MLTIEQKQCVKVVAVGLKQRLVETQILHNLVNLGLSAEGAPKAFKLIEHGIKSGVNAGVTNGLSAQNYQPGKSELYDAAFQEGYRAFKNQLRLIWFRRLVIPVVVLAAVFWILLMKWLK